MIKSDEKKTNLLDKYLPKSKNRGPDAGSGLYSSIRPRRKLQTQKS